jgi:hypothetical protein
MQAHYEALLDDNGNQVYTIPNDFYTVIPDAIDYAVDSPIVELHSPELLYMFEFYRIAKIEAQPRNQIPMAITSLLQDKGLNFPFINDNNEWE